MTLRLAMATTTSVEYYLGQTFSEIDEWIDVVHEIQKEEAER